MRSLETILFVTSLAAALAGDALADEPRAPNETACDTSDRVAEAQRWSRLRDELSARYAREPSASVAAQLGSAEVHMGLVLEGAQHLARALRELPKDDPARVAARADLEIAKRDLVTVRVSVDRPGAAIYIDEVLVDASPLDRELYLAEGAHVVRASMGQDLFAEKAIEGKLGARYDVALTLALRPEAQPPPPNAPPAAAPKSSAMNAGFAIGGVAIGVGIGFAIAAATKHGDTGQFDRLAAMNMGAGAAVLAFTAAYALWPRTAPAATSSLARPKTSAPLVSLSVGVAPNSAFALLHGDL